MSKLINWELYFETQEAIFIWKNKIEKRVDKIFSQIKKRKIEENKNNLKTEKLFLSWKLNFA